jgi:hypothetical protein
LRHLIFFGGGRWAKVLIAAAFGADENLKVSVVSPSNMPGMHQWASGQIFHDKVFVDDQAKNQHFDGAVVVNAAKDHFHSIMWCQKRGVPVLAEKPLTMHSEQTEQLLELVYQKQLHLMPAHVFRFRQDIIDFAETTRKNFDAIHLNWADPTAEIRHGEMKKYDSSLTIHEDWMPHIVSVLSRFLEVDDLDLVTIKTDCVNRSEGTFSYGKKQILIKLTRNAEKRERRITVYSAIGNSVLDFAGTDKINSQGASVPSEKMMKYFLQHIVDKRTIDPEEIKIASVTNKLCKQIAKDFEWRQTTR